MRISKAFFVEAVMVGKEFVNSLVNKDYDMEQGGNLLTVMDKKGVKVCLVPLVNCKFLIPENDAKKD